MNAAMEITESTTRVYDDDTRAVLDSLLKTLLFNLKLVAEELPKEDIIYRLMEDVRWQDFEVAIEGTLEDHAFGDLPTLVKALTPVTSREHDYQNETLYCPYGDLITNIHLIANQLPRTDVLYPLMDDKRWQDFVVLIEGAIEDNGLNRHKELH